VINFFRNLQINRNSFWLGFIAGALFLWLISKLRVYLPGIIKYFRKAFVEARESISAGTENRLRNDIFRFTQKQHLAAPFFALDEIAIEPKLITPPPQISLKPESIPFDITSLTIPYIPDWPELAAIYQAPTMPLIDALQGGSNIALVGHTGSGKTFALAWLASRVARNDPRIGVLTGFLPLYVRATDIVFVSENQPTTQPATDSQPTELSVTPDQSIDSIPQKSENPLDILVKAVSVNVSPLTLPRLPVTIRTAMEEQRTLLLIDSVDELAPQQTTEITSFVKTLIEQFPNNRVIISVSFDNMAGFPTLGFYPLAMASWGDNERADFLNKWSQLWNHYIYPEDPQSLKINSLFLKNWLLARENTFIPLEYTLKVWAAYAGDIIGNDGSSAIEAYIRRMTSHVSNARSALESFALDMLVKMNATANPRDADRLMSEIGSTTQTTEMENAPSPTAQTDSIPTNQDTYKNLGVLDSLTNNGFLISHPGSRLGFSHPVFYGYLAGSALASSGNLPQIQSHPFWTAKTLALLYLARFGDVSSLVQFYLREDDFLHINHLSIARWLRMAPKNKPWRTIVLRTLTTILQKETETLGLVARIITALALSGDAGVTILFRQLLNSQHTNLRQLSALGSGIVADSKAVEDLLQMLQDPNPSLIRAACLALVTIGDKPSLEALASTLLHGSEIMRRSAAEALANNPKEGHPALEEGSAMDDLMVRRSVVFGLMRVNQPWAIKTIQRMELEDKEWIVRNAAIQVMEELQKKNTYAPQPMPDLTEIQWLNDYAARIGTTVAPGKPAEDLVLQVLKKGNEEERLCVIDYLGYKCDEDFIPYLFSIYYGSTGEVKDAAYHVLWLMAISGIKLPSPHQFGLG
jgi:hypothetical protein